MKYDQLYKYAIAKYTNKMIHSEDDSYFKDELLLNRRGRNLVNDKLGPLNVNLGRHAATQSTFLYMARNIYNHEVPNILSNIDDPTRFKMIAKKHFLNKLDISKIKIRTRNKPIIQPYLPEIDEPCISVNRSIQLHTCNQT